MKILWQVDNHFWGVPGLNSRKTEQWRIDAFELWYWRRLLRVPLDCKDIQPVYPKGNQSWMFIGRTNAEAETPVLWPPDVKNWLTRKDPVAGKDWSQEKRTTEDETVWWHHQLNAHEFEQTPGVWTGKWWTGKLVCFSPWGCGVRLRLSDWTELDSGPMCGKRSFDRTNKQFSDTSWVSWKWAQLWHYLPRDGVRFSR